MSKKKYSSTDIDISELFDTLDKRKFGISSFLSLQRTNGWQLIVQVLNKNIDDLKEEILKSDFGKLSDIEYRRVLDLKRDRIKFMEFIRDLPSEYISKLHDEGETGIKESELDPYDQPEIDNS